MSTLNDLHEEVNAAAQEAIASSEAACKKAMKSRIQALESLISSYRALMEACGAKSEVGLANPDLADGRQAKRDKALLAALAANCVLHAHDVADTAGWLRKINEINQCRKDLLGY